MLMLAEIWFVGKQPKVGINPHISAVSERGSGTSYSDQWLFGRVNTTAKITEMVNHKKTFKRLALR